MRLPSPTRVRGLLRCLDAAFFVASFEEEGYYTVGDLREDGQEVVSEFVTALSMPRGTDERFLRLSFEDGENEQEPPEEPTSPVARLGTMDPSWLEIIAPLYSMHMGCENMGYTSAFLLQALEDNQRELQFWEDWRGREAGPQSWLVSELAEKTGEEGSLHCVDNFAHEHSTAPLLSQIAKRLRLQHRLRRSLNPLTGASTHFEPVYARYVFPCIDEPAAKACFKISIVAPSALTVVSNMPQESSRVLSDGVTEHVFAETPRMSSYLLGFAIGDFSVIHEPGNSPVPMALYAPRGKEKMGQFALEIAAYSLAFFEKFFDQKFPLPKLDLVVPPAFPIGVLEVNLSVCGDIWEVTQRRFSLHDSHHCLHAQDENGKQEKRVKLNPWTVPICIQHDGSQSTERTTFSETRTTIPRKGAGRRHVIVKSGSALQPTDRVGLVNDTFAMMRAGMVEPATLLSLCESLLPSEKDPMAWVGHIGILRKALTVFEDSFDKDEAPELPRFLIHLVDRLGWEEPAQEDAWDSLLRPEVLSLLAACQEPMVCKESIQRAETYLCAQHPAPKKSSINLKAAFESACSICGGLEIPNSAVRGVALKVGLSNKGALWKPMCERLKVASNTEERDQLLVAMMGHSDRMVLENWVASAIQGQLPSQEWGTMFAGLAGNRHHKRLAWNMLTRHWDAVYKVWGQSQFKMKAIIASAMVKADPDEVELFFDSHPCEMAKRTIQQGLEGLAADAFLSDVRASIDSFLSLLWPHLAPGALILLHSTLTNSSVRGWLENISASPWGPPNNVLSLLEPHKKFQNSVTILQHRPDGYAEPIYSKLP
eukprot:g21099.t1